MDPVSALGVAAATGQFAEQALTTLSKLIDLYKRSRRAQATVQSQKTRLEQIKGIADQIKSNTSLQTPIISSVLQNCNGVLVAIEDVLSQLLQRLSRGGFWKVPNSLLAAMKEQHTEKLFDDLKEHKMDLMLCLEQQNTTLIANPLIQARGAPNVPSQPGSKTMLWKVPNRHVQHFVGRGAILARLKQTLIPPEDSSGLQSSSQQHRVVLRGLGGQGKTQIALQFCRYCREKHSDEMDAIIWVDASSEASLKTNYERLADTLNHSQRTFSDSSTKLDFVRETVENFTRRWLIVYDNFDSPGEFGTIEDYIPDSPRGSILFTSRHADTADLVRDVEKDFIEVSGLEPEPAQELLLKLTSRTATTDKEHAPNVVSKLCYHPLAITQAAAFIKKRRISLADFESHYQRSMRNVLENTPSLTRYRKQLSAEESEVALNVFTTWELSFQQLESGRMGKGAEGKLLHISAFIGGSEISENLFQTYQQPKKGDVSQDVELNEWLSIYATSAPGSSTYLDQCHNGTPRQSTSVEGIQSVHPPEVQEFYFERNEALAKDDLSSLSSYSTIEDDLASLSLSFGSSRTSLSLNSALNDNEAYSKNALSLDVATDALPSSALTDAHQGQHWNHDIFASQMIRLYDLSLIRDYELKSFDEYHFHIHLLVQDWIKLRCTEDNYCQYFAMAARLVGYSVYESFDPDTQRYRITPDEKQLILGHINNLQNEMQLWTLAFDSKKDPQVAEFADLWNKTLENVRLHLTSCAIYVVSVYEGEVGRSILYNLLPPHLLQNLSSLTIDKDSDLILPLFTLYNTFANDGEYSKAETLSIGLHQLSEKNLGRDDRTTISALVCQAQAVSLQERFDDARVIYEKALEDLRSFVDPNLWMHFHVRGEIAWCVSFAGRLEEGERLFREAFRECRDALGLDSAITLNMQFKLAHQMLRWGQDDEALDVFRENAEHFARVMGKDNPDTLESVRTLIKLLDYAGQQEEADVLRERFEQQ